MPAIVAEQLVKHFASDIRAVDGIDLEIDEGKGFGRVTYVLEGMRSLVLEGWDWRSLASGSAAILGLGAFAFALTLTALRSRTA
jgi:hypothetical protein